MSDDDTTLLDQNCLELTGKNLRYIHTYIRLWKVDKRNLNMHAIKLHNTNTNANIQFRTWDKQEPCCRRETARSRVNFDMYSQWGTLYETFSERTRKVAFATTALSFDITSPANPDEYWHKTYIARNHRPWPTFLPLTVYTHLCAF